MHVVKTFFIVRLTIILILASCLHVCAATGAQQITLNEQRVSLDMVFRKITEQTGYLFVYRDEWLTQAKTVSISVYGASLKEVLDICFADQPFTYVLVDKMVVLKERPAASPPASAPDTAKPKGLIIRGRVSDSLGAPLTGASIRIKGTAQGGQSDIRGEFELKNIPEGTVLDISYIGYIRKELTVSAKDIPYRYIVLQRRQDALDASVIQAYGTTSRRFNVGSISTVDAATIEKQPVTNVLLALEGQVPGLAVTATTGVPGSKVLLQVRGQNTLTANPENPGAAGFKPYDQPLVVIDGVPTATQNANVNQFNSLTNQQTFNGGINQLGGISPFATVNPADIESITVLKDADATSIYGTQGSNGVILITTKKGKPGKTIFNLVATTGFNSDAGRVKFLNTPQYLQFREQADLQDSIVPNNDPNSSSGYAPDLLVFDSSRYTNWEKVLYGKTSNNTDIHGSLSGGAYNNTFIISGGYTRSDFNYPGHFSDQRLSEHSMLHHVSNNNRLVFDFGVDFGYDQNHSAKSGGNEDILLPPNMPSLVNPDGSLVWNYKGVDLSDYQFYSSLLMPVNLQTYNFINDLHLTYKILPGLSMGVTAGYNRNTSNEYQDDPSTAQNPLRVNRDAQFANNNSETVDVTPQIDYNVTLGKGSLSALLGGEYKKNSDYRNTVQGYGYTNDALLGSINGASSVYSFDNTSLYKYDAAFARLNYIYNQEFILSLSGRRDGSSNFGPGRQFGWFGSVAGGWIFTQEKALRRSLPVLSFGKIYASYGTSGSDGIAPFLYQAFWQPNSNIPAFQNTRPNMPLNLYNPNYSWATKKSLNIALDLGFFHDRLLVNGTWYRNREGNQLGGYPLPMQTGFSNVAENLPSDIQNMGWELSFTSTNIKTKHFTWNTSFNLTFNRNKLLSFPNLEASPYATSYVIGQPVSVVLGYKYKDVNPTTGLFEYYTAKGQVTSNPEYGLPASGGDYQVIGNQEIKAMGGFGNTFTCKRLSLYLFFQFSDQEAPNWLYSLYTNYFPGFAFTNMPTAVLGHYWTVPGDMHATLQRLMTSQNSQALDAAADFGQSSGAYSDDAYVRLKTVSLSYALSDNLTKYLHIHDAKIYCNAQNLLTFTNYKVSDPELLNDFTTFPVQRIVAFGLTCNF